MELNNFFYPFLEFSKLKKIFLKFQFSVNKSFVITNRKSILKQPHKLHLKRRANR